MNHSLDDALAGLPSAIEGFGLEKLTLSSPFWEERLSLDERGRVRLFTRRSIADVSGEPIGEYCGEGGAELVRRVLSALRYVPFDGPRARAGVRDVRTQLTVVAGGEPHELVLVREPGMLAASQQLLQELDHMALLARQSPVMTLALELSASVALERGTNEVHMRLRFRNDGTQGFWITHPASFRENDRADHCMLEYGPRVSVQPGVTPLPVEVRRTPLVASGKIAPLLWVPPQSAVEHDFHAQMLIEQPCELILRASFSSYMGQDTSGGRPRLRGCVFSNELPASVR